MKLKEVAKMKGENASVSWRKSEQVKNEFSLLT